MRCHVKINVILRLLSIGRHEWCLASQLLFVCKLGSTKLCNLKPQRRDTLSLAVALLTGSQLF